MVQLAIVHPNNGEKTKIIHPNRTIELSIRVYKILLEILPPLKPNANSIVHEDEDLFLSIKSNKLYGMPFGAAQKSLLLLLMNEVKKTNSPVIPFGKIYSKLCNIYQLPNFVSNSHFNELLYDQILRLFSTQISFYERDNSQIENFYFWRSPLTVRKLNVSASSVIVFSKELFESLQVLNTQEIPYKKMANDSY